MDGYHGQILRIDLTETRSWAEELSEEVLRAYVGGVGLGTYLLYRFCPPLADPLGPKNPLILATCPFVGTSITTSAKYAVLAKSPLTGFIGDSLSGSHLAIELKRTGFDAIVITGVCASWSVLHLHNGEIAIEDAQDLLGLDTLETEEALRCRGLEGRAAVIGPAGERLVRFATISNGGRHAGRTGTGAVMGSKRLKAIVVKGDRASGVADRAGLQRANRELIARSTGPATAKYRVLGTPANLLSFDRLGILPSYNFSQSTFAGAERVSGEELHRNHLAGVAGCASCTIGCEHLYKTLDDDVEAGTRLEYETTFALGPMLGIADPNDVIRAARLCDALGLDSISAGGTLAWAMECVGRGALSEAALAGIPLRFGDATGVLAALGAIGRRHGIGDLLAEGSRRAAARLGGGSEAWAMHVKGLEIPGYEPRGLKTMALGFAVCPRGACHNRVAGYEADLSGAVDRFAAEVARGQIAADAEDAASILDSLILCKFVRHCLDDLYADAAHLYTLVTGWPMTGPDLQLAGQRINTTKKLFNIREGWTRADDTLPERCLSEAVPDGPGAGQRLTRDDLELMISGYYHARRWADDGTVPRDTLDRLHLPDLLALGA
jgi:aldehyde:ferredoxin oxidoreductase